MGGSGMYKEYAGTEMEANRAKFGCSDGVTHSLTGGGM